MILTYISGIAVSSLFSPIQIITFIFLSVPLLAFIASYKKLNWLRTLTVVIIFSLSVLYFNLRTNNILSDNNVRYYADGKLHTIEGVVIKPVVFKDKGRKEFALNVISILKDGETLPVSGGLLLRTNGIGDRIGYGDLIKFKGYLNEPVNFNNPGAFDYAGYLNRKGIHVTSNLNKKNRLISVRHGYKKGAFYYLQKVRERANDFIYERGLSNNKRVVSALIFGGTKQINSYVHKLFINTGTSHILAISGLHMGVIAIFFYYLSLFFLKRSERLSLKYNIIKIAYSSTLVFLILYSLLIGMRVSSVRAVIMIGVYILSVLFERAQNTLRTMFVAAFIILLVYPTSLYDVSFMLSFTAVFAILYFYPKLNLKLDKYFVPRNDQYFRKRFSLLSIVKSSILVFMLSVVINIIVLPIILYNFNYVSLTSPLLNAIVIPVYSVLVIPINFLIFIFSFILPPLGEALLHINEYIIYLTILLLKFLDRYLNVPLYTATPEGMEIVLYYGFVLSVFNYRDKKFKIATFAFAVLLLLTGLYYKIKPFCKETLSMNFIDVGQGESILINFKNGERMLIDGGGFYKTSRFDIGRDVVAKSLWKQKVTRIDYIVSTHPHPDHMGGLFFIASQFDPKKIFIGKHDYKIKMYSKFIRRFSDKIEFISEANSSMDVAGSRVSFFNYDYEGALKSDTDINQSSLVLMLEHEKTKILFTSDIDNKTEEILINQGIDLDCDILKVAHHGSRTSSSKRFMDATSPKYAVISVGRNNYFRLPSGSTLKMFNERGIDLYRTDEDGMVSIVINENKFKIIPFIDKI